MARLLQPPTVRGSIMVAHRTRHALLLLVATAALPACLAAHKKSLGIYPLPNCKEAMAEVPRELEQPSEAPAVELAGNWRYGPRGQLVTVKQQGADVLFEFMVDDVDALGRPYVGVSERWGGKVSGTTAYLRTSQAESYDLNLVGNRLSGPLFDQSCEAFDPYFVR